MTSSTPVDSAKQDLLLTHSSILYQVTNLRARGVQFLSVPDKYYDNLRERLKTSPIKVKEDLDKVNIGDNNYCLSITIIVIKKS